MSEWIPIRMGLPKAHDKVLVTRDHDGGNSVCFAWIDRQGVWHRGDKDISDVIAWMPVPDPYEEDE